MEYSKLRELMDYIDYSPLNSSVILGCECGCGGEFYTSESWDEEEKKVEEAKDKLRELGITFEED